MLLEIKGLNAGYGDVQVLWDVALKVAPGQVVALVGANGAGKSTLLKIISGLLPPYSGQIWYSGADITAAPSKEIVRADQVSPGFVSASRRFSTRSWRVDAECRAG